MTQSLDFIELTILLPCLNEARTVGACVEEAALFLKRSGIRGEIVVADTGSHDGSATIAESRGARIVRVPLRGYGAAINAGCFEARGLFIVIADADGSYDLANLDEFVEALHRGAELVVGNRFRGGISPGAMPWKNRYIGNPVLSWIGKLLFGKQVGDFHCGLRALRKEALPKLQLSTTGMEFASEMIIKSLLVGLKVVEVPTTLRPDGREGSSHLRPWRDGWRHLRLMLLFAPRFLFLYPGLALIGFGGVLLVALSQGPINVFGVIFDIHTLLYAAFMVLLGAQCLMFGAFVHVYSRVAGLKPMSSPLERLLKPASLELGVLAGITLVVAGLLGTISGVLDWSVQGFVYMDPRNGFRKIVPSTALMFLGVQVMISSFFMGVLKIGIRRESPLSIPSQSASARLAPELTGDSAQDPS